MREEHQRREEAATMSDRSETATPNDLRTADVVSSPIVAPATFLLENPGPDIVWRRYCGFIDLSMRDFTDIQDQLLMEQIDLIHTAPLGRRLLRGTVPHSVAEFRANVPLTTYSDYVAFLSPGQDDSLQEKPVAWAQTTGAQADFKWAPYTRRGLERTLDNLMAAFILASASQAGEVNVWPGDTVLYNAPERPYFSGLLIFGMRDRFGFKGILDAEVSEHLDFKERIRAGFKEALGRRVDIIMSMTSVLVKVGEGFAEEARGTSGQRDRSLLRPRALLRTAKALTKSKLLRRPVLPKDLWPVKAILGWGTDTRFFRDRVERYWGSAPFEVYGCTEGGLMGMQTWERKGLIFNPYSDFYEFIPLEESLKSREDTRYQPQTVLLDEVIPGETYELVITNFYGMAFVRYRIGHFVQFHLDEGISPISDIPQFTFGGRSDDRIDLAGFTRIDEKSIWDSLALTDLQFESWIARKESEGDIPILHVYIELKQERPSEVVREEISRRLKEVDPFYNDLESMLEIRPLRVTILNPGAFDVFYEQRREAGIELGRRTPARMNAVDEDVKDLLKASSQKA